MATPLVFARACAARMFELGAVTAVRMFGGAALRLDDLMIGLVMREVLYLRVDDESRAVLAGLGGEPFRYRRGEREVSIAGYLSVPARILEDPAELSRLGAAARRAAKAAPKRGRRARGAAQS